MTSSFHHYHVFLAALKIQIKSVGGALDEQKCGVGPVTTSSPLSLSPSINTQGTRPCLSPPTPNVKFKTMRKAPNGPKPLYLTLNGLPLPFLLYKSSWEKVISFLSSSTPETKHKHQI
jgi:hypothetical protein